MKHPRRDVRTRNNHLIDLKLWLPVDHYRPPGARRRGCRPAGCRPVHPRNLPHVYRVRATVRDQGGDARSLRNGELGRGRANTAGALSEDEMRTCASCGGKKAGHSGGTRCAACWKKESPSAEERFWAKVDKTGECWVWTASKRTNGYGQIGSTGGRWRPLQAHRVSWVLHFGPIPDGLWVLHRCDNRPCVRPDHLFLGTVTDNNRDMVAKGRAIKPEQHARGERASTAKLTADQVRELRAAHAAGESAKSLAARFGISTVMVGRIRNRRDRRHVD